MSKLFFFLAILFSLSGVAQESFLVLHVKGNIAFDSISKPLNVGDEFVGNPILKFSTRQDIAVILSSVKGRVVLFADKPAKETASALVFYFKTNILPVKEYTATRGSDDNATLLLFKANTLYRDKLIKVMKLPKDEQSYYYMSYVKNGIEHKSKLQVTTKGFIKIEAKTFEAVFDADTPYSPEAIALNFYNAETDHSALIESISFIPHQLEAIEKELKLYHKWLLKQGDEDNNIYAKLTAYIHETYASDLDLNDFKFD